MSVQMSKYSLRLAFKQMLQDKDYASLGRFFWMGMITFGDWDKRSEVMDELWDSLTFDQQCSCEG
jgi:hypothetical protein